MEHLHRLNWEGQKSNKDMKDESAKWKYSKTSKVYTTIARNILTQNKNFGIM
jgi:hypothetical protein